VDARSKVDLDRDPTAIVTTREIAAPRDLVFEAWTDPRHLAQWWGPNGFTTTSGRTRITLHATFPSAAERECVVREYGADTGAEQTLSRLADYVGRMA